MVVVRASLKSCDLDAEEKAYIPYPPEQFPRETTVPRDILGLREAQDGVGRKGKKW